MIERKRILRAVRKLEEHGRHTIHGIPVSALKERAPTEHVAAALLVEAAYSAQLREEKRERYEQAVLTGVWAAQADLYTEPAEAVEEAVDAIAVSARLQADAMLKGR